MMKKTPKFDINNFSKLTRQEELEAAIADNPDLPPEFIKDVLEGWQDVLAGRVTDYALPRDDKRINQAISRLLANKKSVVSDQQLKSMISQGRAGEDVSTGKSFEEGQAKVTTEVLNNKENKGATLTDYDPADSLTNTEAIIFFLEDALDTKDWGYMRHALHVAKRAAEKNKLAAKSSWGDFFLHESTTTPDFMLERYKSRLKDLDEVLPPKQQAGFSAKGALKHIKAKSPMSDEDSRQDGVESDDP